MLQKLRSIDARIFFLLFFLGVFVDAFALGIKMKTPVQLVAAFIGALGTDILLNYVRHRKWIFPLSGLVSSCGTFMLLTTPHVWPYLLVGFLSIYSKHFITYNNRHIFNPVNFGATLGLFYLGDYVQNGASTWSGSYNMLPYLVVLGTILVTHAGSFFLSASYLLAFYLVHTFYLYQFLPVNIASFSAPPFMLFVFFMISDPRTTPRKIVPQILFGTSVALVEAVFKYNKILNGGLWTLLIINFTWDFLRPAARDLARKFVPAGGTAA